MEAVALGDRLPLTSVSLPKPLSKRFSPAAPLAPKRRRLPPPGSLPGSPPRRAPVPPDPWHSDSAPAPRGHPWSPASPGGNPPAPRVPVGIRTGAAAAARRLRPPGGEGVQGLRQPRARSTPTHRPRGWSQRLLLFHVVAQRLAQVLLGRLQLAHKGRHCSARLRPTADRAAHSEQQP